MRFIPIDKMKKLREAAKNGDEKAKKIIKAQLGGEDFSADLDTYFAPVPAPAAVEKPNIEPGLRQFLEDNDVSEDSPEYNDFVEDYYKEFPNQRPKNGVDTSNMPIAKPDDIVEDKDVEEEVDLTKDMANSLIEIISRCDQTLVLVLNNDDIDDTAKKGVMVTLQEIKQSILDNFEKLKKIKKTLNAKEEEEPEKEVLQ